MVAVDGIPAGNTQTVLMIKKPKKKPISYWKKKADALFSKIVRARGKCEMCGKDVRAVQLQCAHIVTRSNLHLRHNLKNALALCATCHWRWHKEPLWAIGWFDTIYGDRAKYLREERNIIEHTLDYQEVIEKLEKL